MAYALFTRPLSSIPRIFQGFLIELSSLILNCLNIAVSFITFVTRTISTIFNLGYLSINRANIFNRLDRNIQHIFRDLTINMMPISIVLTGIELACNTFADISLLYNDIQSSNSDDSIMEQTFSF